MAPKNKGNKKGKGGNNRNQGGDYEAGAGRTGPTTEEDLHEASDVHERNYLNAMHMEGGDGGGDATFGISGNSDEQYPLMHGFGGGNQNQNHNQDTTSTARASGYEEQGYDGVAETRGSFTGSGRDYSSNAMLGADARASAYSTFDADDIGLGRSPTGMTGSVATSIGGNMDQQIEINRGNTNYGGTGTGSGPEDVDEFVNEGAGTNNASSGGFSLFNRFSVKSVAISPQRGVDTSGANKNDPENVLTPDSDEGPGLWTRFTNRGRSIFSGVAGAATEAPGTAAGKISEILAGATSGVKNVSVRVTEFAVSGADSVKTGAASVRNSMPELQEFEFSGISRGMERASKLGTDALLGPFAVVTTSVAEVTDILEKRERMSTVVVPSTWHTLNKFVILLALMVDLAAFCALIIVGTEGDCGLKRQIISLTAGLVAFDVIHVFRLKAVMTRLHEDGSVSKARAFEFLIALCQIGGGLGAVLLTGLIVCASLPQGCENSFGNFSCAGLHGAVVLAYLLSVVFNEESQDIVSRTLYTGDVYAAAAFLLCATGPGWGLVAAYHGCVSVLFWNNLILLGLETVVAVAFIARCVVVSSRAVEGTADAEGRNRIEGF
eukprot:g2153.t1